MSLAPSGANRFPHRCRLLVVIHLKILVISWFFFTLAAFSWLFFALPTESGSVVDSTIFLPGETTHGHYQIELKCSACHTPNGEVSEQSCIDCHGKALKLSRDTHPKSKFRDPAKAELLAKIDAANCLTCHAEHEEDRTLDMGVTVPADFCFHCHEGIANDRPSHAGMSFDTCSNAGCHNYHDNTALYENFLKKHLDESDFLEPAIVRQRSLFRDPHTAMVSDESPRSILQADAPKEFLSKVIDDAWAESSHALAGVNCSGCHNASSTTEKDNRDSSDWVSDINHTSCESCHKAETDGFLGGKHGMRLSVGLSPMTPELARHPMHSGRGHEQLSCASCHDPHQPDLRFAAHDACLSCHNDQHSRQYLNSGHHQLWLSEVAGQADVGSGVSCATCHMPRDEDGRVQHNQNLNLQPNEKMIRTTCQNCHGLQFTVDALADPVLKANCYSTSPTTQIDSLEMVRRWFESKEKRSR